MHVAHLLGHAMEGLAREGGARQAGHARQAGVQEVPQVPLGSGRASPLDRNGHRQLAQGRAVLGSQARTGSINVSDQIKLLGHPDQRAHIAHRARTHGARGAQICEGRRSDGAQHHLTRDRTTSLRIPDRLGGDAVAVAIDLALENMHLFHVSAAVHAEYRKTLSPSESGPSPAQKYIQSCEGPASARTHMLMKMRIPFRRERKVASIIEIAPQSIGTPAQKCATGRDNTASVVGLIFANLTKELPD